MMRMDFGDFGHDGNSGICAKKSVLPSGGAFDGDESHWITIRQTITRKKHKKHQQLIFIYIYIYLERQRTIFEWIVKQPFSMLKNGSSSN